MASKIKLNMDDLTLGDLEDYEDYVGMPLADALKERPIIGDDGQVVRDERGRPKKEVQLTIKALTGIVWVVERTANPDFTVEDARKVKVSELEIDESPAETRESRDVKKDDAPN